MASADRSSSPRPDRALARYLVQPVARFLEIEASGGIVLLGATVVALIWANSLWSASYHDVWTTNLRLGVGPVHRSEDLTHWVNDGPMALFFFVVGLEIKRELVVGRLSDRRDAALPVLAALGGMIVPAILFLAVNAGGVGASGWGVPMATDIAFAVGVVALLGRRVPDTLRVLLLGLAIADDIGVIAVIAIFYADELDVRWLLAAGVGLGIVTLMRLVRVDYLPAYAAVGLGVWGCTLQSGIHATIAGVALGLLTPVIVAERVETALHPWTSYLVIPVFALANAGIPVGADVLRDAVTSSITLGVALGLVVGKLVGVSAFAWLAVRFGVARLPEDVRWRQLVGIAAIAGIGFTVSIFVAGLAYDDPGRQAEAKIGVLVASVLAAAGGSLLLSDAGRRPEKTPDSMFGGWGAG
jgi:Na+:H+ antiporter, NhaA family